MPRFDREGFNPQKRIDNDSRDRSVPDDENYYVSSTFNSIDDNEVIDNQVNNIIDDFDNNSRVSQKYNDVPPRKMPKETKPKKHSSKNKGKKIFLSIIAFILIIVILCVSFVASAFGKITYDDKRDNQYVTSSSLKNSSKVKNILLLGVDARSSDDDTESRSDTMMLVSIDSEHKCIKMVSFLRDTWVYIPSMDQKQRLNAACSSDGYNGVVDTIEYNFGIDIDGYVVADFEMFKVLVDSIGGVEVEVSDEEAEEVTSHPYRYDNVTLESGTYKLTGEQALAYCRIRKIDTDFMRAYRQRIVMQSILKGIKSANPLKLLSMATKCAPYIETNLSKLSILSCAFSALPCISDMVESRVPFDGTWQYETISGNSVITIDLEKNKEQLIDLIYTKTADEIRASSE